MNCSLFSSTANVNVEKASVVGAATSARHTSSVTRVSSACVSIHRVAVYCVYDMKCCIVNVLLTSMCILVHLIALICFRFLVVQLLGQVL